jgi:TPR repeat protein
MNGQIFISYRREDASYPAGRLYDNLRSCFPQNEIFMDVDSIKPGIDFIETIEERVGSCDVLVAVIGKGWLSAADEEGKRRLDNPEDFVRVEVGTALKRGVRVIPVLVEGASMPRAAELPEELRPLVRRNALSVSHDRFRADSKRLMDSVGEVLGAARLGGPSRTPERQQQRGRGSRQDNAEPLPGIGTGPSTPASNRASFKEVTANLNRPRRLLVVTGIGVVVCLLGVGLFKATRPQPVSIGGYSSPTPAPLGTASNPQSPTPLVSQASPRPGLSGVGWFAEAKRYLDIKDYVKALPFLEKAADAGNAEGMNGLGLLYEQGWGVSRDYAQALEWFQKAVEAGNTEALEHLGFLYEHGDGVAQNYVTAREYYQKAADRGNAVAMTNLGFLYEKGARVTQDYAQARQWFQRAADAGDAKAKQALLRLPANIPASSPSPLSQPSPSPTPATSAISAPVAAAATRPQPFSIEGSPSPTPAPLGAALKNSDQSMILAILQAIETHDSHALLAYTQDEQLDYFGHKNASHAFIQQDMEQDAKSYKWLKFVADLDTYQTSLGHDSIEYDSRALDIRGKEHRARCRLEIYYTPMSPPRLEAISLKVLR